jgi:Ca2+-transporting ATPase
MAVQKVGKVPAWAVGKKDGSVLADGVSGSVKDWSALELEDVYSRVGGSEVGLSVVEAEARLVRVGPNSLHEKSAKSPFRIFLSQFASPVVWVLLAAVVISVVIGEFIDASVICVILLLNAFLGTFQELRAQKSIAALKKMLGLKSDVLRDGHPVSVDSVSIVPGDVLILETGDKVPADARVFEAVNLEVQESALTGESLPDKKAVCVLSPDVPLGDKTNMVFCGTLVTRGRCRAVVVETGMRTQIGKIAELIQEAKDTQSPLQRQLGSLSKWLGAVTVAVCILVFFAEIVFNGGDWFDLFLVAVALAVAAIPEGLPAVVTISLSLGVERLAKKNALMRHLPSVETLGCVTVICTDKTGTLTHDEMTVKRIYAGGQEIVVEGSGYRPDSKIDASDLAVRRTLEIGALCNDSSIDKKTWSAVGDPTECCLVSSALKGGIDDVDLRIRFHRLDEVEFDSERKLMTTVHKIDGKLFAYVKGAPDILLSKCGSIFLEGKSVKLNDINRRLIASKNEEYADSSLRVLGFAFKEIDKVESDMDSKVSSYESGLTFVGLQAMMDPPRKEVFDSIRKCEAAGIRVMMVTGDHKATALAIAKELGIKGSALTGVEIDAMGDDEFASVIRSVGVCARVDPKHKVRIVEALKMQGNVVAMTGDGVNDAPALKIADIGIAMGRSGTDVAKEASEMVLVDDNFTSIVNAVEEGRGIYSNMRKFVNYLLSCNIAEVLVVFLSSVFFLPLPLVAIQLLWVNLVTDGLPAVALGVDPVPLDAMSRKPRKFSDRIMSKGMLLNVLSIGFIIALASLAAFYVGLKVDLATGRTMVFTTLVFLEIVRLHMIRSVYKTPVFSNFFLLIALVSSLLLQLLVVYSPLNAFFGTVALSLTSWLYIVVILVIVFVVGSVVSRGINRFAHEDY